MIGSTAGQKMAIVYQRPLLVCMNTISFVGMCIQPLCLLDHPPPPPHHHHHEEESVNVTIERGLRQSYEGRMQGRTQFIALDSSSSWRTKYDGATTKEKENEELILPESFRGSASSSFSSSDDWWDMNNYKIWRFHLGKNPQTTEMNVFSLRNALLDDVVSNLQSLKQKDVEETKNRYASLLPSLSQMYTLLQSQIPRGKVYRISRYFIFDNCLSFNLYIYICRQLFAHLIHTPLNMGKSSFYDAIAENGAQLIAWENKGMSFALADRYEELQKKVVLLHFPLLREYLRQFPDKANPWEKRICFVNTVGVMPLPSIRNLRPLEMVRKIFQKVDERCLCDLTMLDNEDLIPLAENEEILQNTSEAMELMGRLQFRSNWDVYERALEEEKTLPKRVPSPQTLQEYLDFDKEKEYIFEKKTPVVLMPKKEVVANHNTVVVKEEVIIHKKKKQQQQETEEEDIFVMPKRIKLEDFGALQKKVVLSVQKKKRIVLAKQQEEDDDDVITKKIKIIRQKKMGGRKKKTKIIQRTAQILSKPVVAVAVVKKGSAVKLKNLLTQKKSSKSVVVIGTPKKLYSFEKRRSRFGRGRTRIRNGSSILLFGLMFVYIHKQYISSLFL